MSKLLAENLIDSIGENSKGTILRSMAVFTAIELCGSFLTGKTGEKTTRENFLTFCESKYLPEAYRKISTLLYDIFRNGVSHSYVAKGAAHLTSASEAKELHLHFCVSGLCIFVPRLAEDVRKGIEQLIIDLKQEKELNDNYHKILLQLHEDGEKIYQRYVKENNIKTKAISFKGDISIEL
jgi:translation initiation factor 2 beta subunit (eIF-2beta)/eIF-5